MREIEVRGLESWSRMLGGNDESLYLLEFQDSYEKREHPAGWLDLMHDLAASGFGLRWARVVSEPVSEWIRADYETTERYIEAGFEVKWLPRLQITGLAMPTTDCWIFDGLVVLFNHYAGDGSYVGQELRAELKVVDVCIDAFNEIWEMGIPHSEYKLA